MNSRLRSKVSSLKAQVMTLLGKPGGFFIEYDYVDGLQPVSTYGEVEKLCEASPFREVLQDMASYVADYKQFGSSPTDPEWTRRMISPLDGIAAYTMVKKFEPKRILEIGSGSSTRFLVKAAMGRDVDIACIDPAPRRDISDLPVTLHQRVLSDQDVRLCDTLAANDILYVDSSHIMLPGMDVDIEFNRFFPRLKSGVLVHVHDIFLPFDYPAAWKSRFWSEQNALIGWLFGSFDIVWPGHYVVRKHPDLIDSAFADFPTATMKSAGSIWLRKR